MHIFIISAKGITCLWLFFVHGFQQHWVCSFVACLLNTDAQVTGGKWKQPGLCKSSWPCDTAGPGLSLLLSNFHLITLGALALTYLVCWCPSAHYHLHIWHCQFCGSNNPEIRKILFKLCKGGNGGGLQETAVKITRACVWAHRENY